MLRKYLKASVTLTGLGAQTYVWSPNVANGSTFTPSINQTYTLSPAIASNNTNRLENRNGVLFFNNERISLRPTYAAVYGYALGGSNSLGGVLATADRVTFSTSTTAAHTPANLSTVRKSFASLSDGIVYGYALGGNTGTVAVTADRITFSTSITAAHTPANLSVARDQLGGLSDGAV